MIAMKNIFLKLTRLPVYAAVGLINTYQLLLSPDHSWLKARHPYGYCRHYPSCSQYAKLALIKHGIAKGSVLSAKRLLKCHPWAESSFDPVP